MSLIKSLKSPREEVQCTIVIPLNKILYKEKLVLRLIAKSTKRCTLELDLYVLQVAVKNGKQTMVTLAGKGDERTEPMALCTIIKDARSVSLYPYNRSQILQYVKYTK